MTDSKPASIPITEATLLDGSTVGINDHVYLVPEHLGESYYIGRIMEFCTVPQRRGLQARIAWYNRPKDVLPRKANDPRLLLATMHSDLNPVSSIRGKCIVTHRHHIPSGELESYKQRDDHFYYDQLYDRYVQRVFDIVPCELVENVPKEVRDSLRERYEFIVVEQGRAAELTADRQTCAVCETWSSSSNSVKCAACQKNYHMSCLNPPLSRKPPKGFAWQCAFCSRKEVPRPTENGLGKKVKHIADNVVSKKESSGEKFAGDAISRRPTRMTRAQLGRANTPSNNAQSDASTQLSQPTQSAKSLKQTEIKLRLSPKASRKEPRTLKYTRMWPFRYFGQHTDMKDVLDIDDRIYPRARNRIGPRYQAEVPGERLSPQKSDTPCSDRAVITPTANETGTVKEQHDTISRDSNAKLEAAADSSTEPEIKRSLSASPLLVPQKYPLPAVKQGPVPKMRGKRGRPKYRRRLDNGPGGHPHPQLNDMDEDKPIERGTSATVTPLFRPHKIQEADLTAYMDAVRTLESKPLPSHSTDLFDRALQELERHNYDTKAALHAMSLLKPSDIPRLVVWSDEEKALFESGIIKHGHDLHSISKMIPTKTIPDLVRHFYQWKKSDRYEPVYSEWTKIYKPSKKFKKNKPGDNENNADSDMESEDAEDSGEDSDPTVVTTRTQISSCVNCHATESRVWRRLPTDVDRKRKHFREVLCNDCGEYWLKYAIMKNAGIGRGKGRLGRSIGEKRKRSMEPQSKVGFRKLKDDKRIMTLAFKPSACAVCDVKEPENILLTCYECGISVHNDCYGSSSTTKEGWICDVCSNKRTLSASYIYECILCCQPPSGTRDALKKTSSYNWVHATCAQFIPECKFVNADTLQPVEYVGAVHPARHGHACFLCKMKKGSCVTCGECKKAVHVHCAIRNHFRIGFEIQAPHKALPSVQAGLFRENMPSGVMVPQVWCPEHDLSKNTIVDLSARTIDTKESSMRVYAKLYKQIEPGTTPASRRYRAALANAGYPYAAAIYGPLPLPDSPPTIPSAIPSARKSMVLAANPTSNRESSRGRSSSGSSSPINSKPSPKCSTCPVVSSPWWWPGATEGSYICLHCFRRKQQNEQFQELPAQY